MSFIANCCFFYCIQGVNAELSAVFSVTLRNEKYYLYYVAGICSELLKSVVAVGKGMAY